MLSVPAGRARLTAGREPVQGDQLPAARHRPPKSTEAPHTAASSSSAAGHHRRLIAVSWTRATFSWSVPTGQRRPIGRELVGLTADDLAGSRTNTSWPG